MNKSNSRFCFPNPDHVILLDFPVRFFVHDISLHLHAQSEISNMYKIIPQKKTKCRSLLKESAIFNLHSFSLYPFSFFKVLTVALRCPDGTIKKRRFTKESPVKVLTVQFFLDWNDFTAAIYSFQFTIRELKPGLSKWGDNDLKDVIWHFCNHYFLIIPGHLPGMYT